MLIMRKLVFAALAGVFMWSSGFATLNSNDLVEKDFGTCSYTIETTYTYADGSQRTFSRPVTTEANSLQHCMAIARNHVAFLNSL
jgi:hypothetical protein